MQLRGFGNDTLPMLRDWSARKGFRVLKYYNSPVGGISLNVEYKADPLLREYFQNKDFRRCFRWLSTAT